MNNHWRWNLPPTVFGIPGYAFVPLLTCIYVDSIIYFFCMLGLVVVYGIFARFGITATVFLEKFKHRLRGNIIHSRPWWFSKNFRGSK